MKYLKYLLIGILFGIVMTKSEAVSWFRIYEMFRFESFHMYGIIGTAVVLGAILIAIIKATNAKTLSGHPITIDSKEKTWIRNIIGGTIFGLGWAMTGACPGPMFTLIGHGVWAILLVIAAAIFGTFIYGVLKRYLPH